MNGYTYSIEAEDGDTQYIVGLSVKAEHKLDADRVVVAHVVNNNTRERLNQERILKNPRLVNVKHL